MLVMAGRLYSGNAAKSVGISAASMICFDRSIRIDGADPTAAGAI